MNIGDRIQRLRKAKGISQEELADKIGVSRQAVSKWESEQSIPDIDRVIIISEYFDVTTDYLLKGIENETNTDQPGVDANVFVLGATALNFIGLIMSAVIWYEQQVAMASVIGLILMASGCLVYGIGLFISNPVTRQTAKRNFWVSNIWIVTFIPFSFIYNVLFTHTAAPYPLLASPLITFPVFWLVYLAVCAIVVWMRIKKKTA